MSSTEHCERVKNYYRGPKARTNYEDFLGRNCHFGYTPLRDPSPYNLQEAQLAMRRLLGTRLNLPPNSLVLDAGCGYGPVSETLADDFELQVVGIDLMPEVLKLARDRDIPDPHFSEADYHRLPFASESFHGVLTMETLVHAQSVEVVLKEFYRVLKPGGVLVLFEYSIPGFYKHIPGVNRLAESVIKRTVMTSLPSFTFGAFPNLLAQAGFIETQVEDISENVYSTWRYLWKHSIEILRDQVRNGEFTLDRIQGSLLIYPARRFLKYCVVVAKKPSDKSENLTHSS